MMAKSDADAQQARKSVPIGGYDQKNGRTEKQRRHDCENRTEAKRLALIDLDIASQCVRGRLVDEAQFRPAKDVPPHARPITRHRSPYPSVNFTPIV